MDRSSPVQPIPLLARIRALFCAGPVDKTLIYEARIAVALLKYPHLTTAGQRALEEHTGIGRDTLQEVLPGEGQWSPAGLLYCHTRGSWRQDYSTPGRYVLAVDLPELSSADEQELRFLDPASQHWTDHGGWALAVLYGDGDHRVSTADLLKILGTRNRLSRLTARLQAKGLAVKVTRGVLHLLFTAATPYEDTRDRFLARKEAHRRERMQWTARLKAFRQRCERAANEIGGHGRLALMHLLGFTDATWEDAVAVDDDLTDEEREWLAERERRLAAA